jgi:hypothetical protein
LRIGLRNWPLEGPMARFASIIVSKRVRAAILTAICFSAAQVMLTSCDPDEFAPIAARIAHLR